jgi:hypothetical protein
VPDGLGALGLVELGARVLEPDVPLGPQSVMAVRELVLALPLASLPVVPVLFWLVVEPALPAVPGAFAVELPESQSMLRSLVSRAPPVVLGLVLVCAMAVPNIKVTTDAAVKIVRRMRFPPFRREELPCGRSLAKTHRVGDSSSRSTVARFVR